MTFEAYFFDFDHTLFDSDASEAAAFSHAMTTNGVSAGPNLFAAYRSINTELWRRVESDGLPPAEVRTLRFADLVVQAELDVDPLALADAFTVGMQESGELYDGAESIVRSLGERGPVVMVTNAISEIQRRRIERLGIAPLFDAIVISSEVGSSKPGRAIFDHALDLVGRNSTDGIDRSSTLMVGDSLTSDMAGGIGAGLATCWFNPRGKPADPALAIDHEITTLARLLDL